MADSVKFSQADITELLNAVDLATKSARRAQRSGRSPQIQEVWKKHEEHLLELEAKLKRYK